GDEDDQFATGELILKSYRAAPKHNKLTKMLAESGNKALMRQVENAYLRDKKLHELDEELYFIIDEKHHSIDLTEEGREVLARQLGSDVDLFMLPDLAEENHLIEINDDLTPDEKAKAKDKLSTTYADRSEKIHNISQLLRAFSLYEKDVEYVLQEGKVLIVDEFTGRLMAGRRYSDGLHQAIEAKEGVKVEGETQTVATITLQNYFRLYSKLAGMTGTAETEENEFWDIYKLEVVVIPTNESIRRVDNEDLIFKTRREKYNAIIEEIRSLNEEGLPILVGTTSVEVSETLSRMLKRHKITHNVLNAKHHKGEAEIVKYAGQIGAVTIATNMAGRGTDIKLGKGVVRWEGEEVDKENAVGGLQIIGTERHESRRIDRQLRGRSGRQGDPGVSIFFLSLEDNLMRLFGSERIANIMDRMGVEEGDVITHSMITKSIEKAQQRVEAGNFSIRKHLLDYDNVMNQQREVIYTHRRSILMDEDIREVIVGVADEFIEMLLDEFADDSSSPATWNQDELQAKLFRVLQIKVPPEEEWDTISKPFEWQDYLLERTMDNFDKRRELYEQERFDTFVRWIALQVVDERWKNHLYDMDRLKEGIGLRAYGQKDPLIEYKREGFDMFKAMLDSTNEDSLKIIFNSVIQEQAKSRAGSSAQLSYTHAEAASPVPGEAESPKGEAAPAKKKQPVKVDKQPGRNDPCPCGSRKKYKKCCGV
ncbi:MAG: SEC-C domain-containing protein, partial [Calditrichaeota bacterium]|nr:SEC-C domain-containing protein [Calditrichota bacterium]